MAFVVVLAVMAGFVAFRWRRSGKQFVEFGCQSVAGCYAQLWHRLRRNSVDPLPPAGPVLLVSNHTCSADAAFLQGGCSRPLCWLASREHYESHPLIRKLLDILHCVPVRCNGKDTTAAREGLKRLEEGRVLCVFPEGNLSGVAAGRLRSPKGGAAWLALRSGAPVVPAWIAGGPRTAQLVRGWVMPSWRTTQVVFGKPVDLSRFQGKPINRRLLEEATTFLVKEIEALKKMSGIKDAGRP